MDLINSIFKCKKVNFSKLLPFGFKKCENIYSYKKVLDGCKFLLTVQISEDGAISSEMIDPSMNEVYTLHLVESATGSFVGEIKSQYKAVLEEIAETCFDPDVFKSNQAKELIAYAREKYGDELEFLWPKFPDNAIWRRQDNKKWYGAILTVSRQKLGLKSDEIVEIVDLRLEPEKIATLVDQKRYFNGWHMNKKNWYTIILDGSVPTKEICNKLDDSYTLTGKK